MKRCSTCKREKSITQFSVYFHKYQKRKYVRSYCIECKRKYQRKWKRKNPSKNLQYSYKWIAKNRKKFLAHQRVQNAIRSGKLMRKNCEKCERSGHAHHDDYNKPLIVRWLCNKHHKQIHNGKSNSKN